MEQKRAFPAQNIVADEGDECLEILLQSFVHNRWINTWSTARYVAWWQTQSELASYRYFRWALQMIGSHDSELRWQLKNPGHIVNLDLLFAVFPNASVVETVRYPSKAIPSLC